MNDYECRICGKSHDQDNTHEGALVHGGYGSTRYDETKLIWLTDGPDNLELGDRICDGCIDTLVANRHLEAFSGAFDRDVGRTMSAEGYARVFILGAEQMYRICASARSESPGPLRNVSSDDEAAIVRLRATIAYDPTQSDQHAVFREPENGRTARAVGEAHVLAGLVLGHFGGGMPDVLDSARAFGARMVEIDTSIAEMHSLELNFLGDVDGEP